MTIEEAWTPEQLQQVDRLIAKVVFKRHYRKPGHGPCCTCQRCGHDHDDCLCGISENLDRAMDFITEPAFADRYQLGIIPLGNGEWVCQSFSEDYSAACTHGANLPVVIWLTVLAAIRINELLNITQEYIGLPDTDETRAQMQEEIRQYYKSQLEESA